MIESVFLNTRQPSVEVAPTVVETSQVGSAHQWATVVVPF